MPTRLLSVCTAGVHDIITTIVRTANYRRSSDNVCMGDGPVFFCPIVFARENTMKAQASLVFSRHKSTFFLVLEKRR